MKVNDVITVFNVLSNASLEGMKKEYKFNVLDLIDAMKDEAEGFDKKREEAVKKLAESERAEYVMMLMNEEAKVEIPEAKEGFLEALMEANDKVPAGLYALIRRMVKEK